MTYRGCQITSSRGFMDPSWTCPPVYEILFHEKNFLDRSNRGWGSNLTPTVNNFAYDEFSQQEMTKLHE